ncbi:MAG: arylsulfatase, partial [Verrucomicrobiales bacterium]
MFRRLLLSISLVLISTDGSAEQAAGGPAQRPNVIVVITDDQGYGDLGCHGNELIKTPNLDDLHSQSTRLTNFHVSPTCAPTRAALMTGRYANATGVWHTIMGRSILRRDEATIGRVFADAGYATGMFGKWHLGDNFPSRPEDMGFEHVVRHGGGGVGQLPDVWGNDYFDDTYWVNGTKKSFEGYCTDIWFSEALSFIESKRGQGQPFLAYLSTNAPHSPFLVGEEYKQIYADNPEVPNAAFYGMISNLDENVGRLLGKLESWGLGENTIVIFMTDNGTSAGYAGPKKDGGAAKGFNAGMRGKKGSEYDGGHRVPFFIRWPAGGVTAGRDIPTLTAHIDVLPTLMEYCGIDNRPEEAPLMHGRSLV